MVPDDEPIGWEPEVAEIHRRQELAEQMGGAANVARAHARGKLTARERIDKLVDKGSFREFGAMVGDALYVDNELTGFTPKPYVHGFSTIGQRKAVVHADDFTVRGGSGGAGPAELGREMSATQRAIEWRVPMIRLLDSAGGSVRSIEQIGRTYLPDGNSFVADEIRALSTIPVVTAVLGSVAGGPAVVACMSHFSVMVAENAQLFVGGPPVVKAALGTDITKEALGGPQVHARESGVVDNLAESEEDALAQIRRFLSYLPQSVHELPPRGEVEDPVDRLSEELLSIVPRNPRKPYDMYDVINAVVDEGSFFEIGALYGKARIAGLARVNGYTIAVIANNAMQMGGSTDVAAGEKSIRLMQLCDTFHIPLVSFADEPGFMVGLDSERRGIERAGARLVWTICQSRMPWFTVVVRRLYGVAGQCHHRPTGMFRRYAWPSANWGSMPISGGTMAAYKTEIESADDPAAKLAEIEARLRSLTSPFRTAEATGQDIIDPRTTRPLLAEFVEEAQHVLVSQLGVPPVPYRP